MNPVTGFDTPEAPPSFEPAGHPLPIASADLQPVAPRRAVADDLAMLVMFVCLALFAGVFVAQVLRPATTTLAGSSVGAGSLQGP